MGGRCLFNFRKDIEVKVESKNIDGETKTVTT